MKPKAVLFDLDGTLLPMDQNRFIAVYFGELVKKMAPYGFDKEKLIAAIWDGTKAMVDNDGSVNNEVRFRESFKENYGEKTEQAIAILETFYANEFQDVASSCGHTAQAAEMIAKCKEMGVRVILATNPIFPAIATHNRIAWAGLHTTDFDWITTYENAHFCKPHPAYYQEILDTCGLKAEDCLMIGNDVDEDMVAQTVGMKVFLLTDCLINKGKKDISKYPNGDFDALFRYMEEISAV